MSQKTPLFDVLVQLNKAWETPKHKRQKENCMGMIGGVGGKRKKVVLYVQ